MELEEIYMKLPFDLSGSRSKNRFRNEILWGLEKTYEVYKTGNDFAVIFDYVCDIEVHTSSKLEFYQVKTHKAPNPYSLNKILKKDKAGKSILGKLYILKSSLYENDANIKLAIVSNTVFKGTGNNIYSNVEELCFSKLDKECKDKVCISLKEELSFEGDISLQDIYYIYTSMDLMHPEESLLGKTVNFFYDVKGQEPKKPKTLFNVLFETITECATYELECNNYEDIVIKKGITRKTIDCIMNQYIEDSDIAVQKSIQEIDLNFTKMNEKFSWKNALTSIINKIRVDIKLQKLEKVVVEYLQEHCNEFNVTIFELIDILYFQFKDKFPVGYQINEQKAFILLIIKKLEEGIYE